MVPHAKPFVKVRENVLPESYGVGATGDDGAADIGYIVFGRQPPFSKISLSAICGLFWGGGVFHPQYKM